MNDDRLDGIPLILETPPDSEDNAVAIAGYKREIDLLRSLVSTAAGGAVGGRKGASVLKDAAAAVKGEPVTAVKETTEKDAVEVKRESKGRKKTTQ